MSNHPLKVLVVEDDPGHASLIGRAFEAESVRMELTLVTTLEEARAKISASPPDVLVADLLLPDGQAIELLPGNLEAAEFPVLIMTSHGDEQLAVETIKAGALEYIVKTETLFLDMPQVIDRALREWNLVLDRKEAREKLAESEAHFRSLIENALDLITVVDERGIIGYQSPSSLRILGRDAGDLLGRSIYTFLNPADRDEVNAGLMLAFAAPGTKQMIICRFRHKDGSWRILESIGSALDSGTGERRVVVNSRDITNRKKAEKEKRILEAQLRQSQKLDTIGTMADGIAHDFNNILTPMLGYTELALEDLPPESRAGADLEHVRRAAIRAQNLVKQILLFSRQAEQDRHPVEPHQIIRESIDLLRASLPANIRVVEEIDKECGTVLADPTQIHQIMMNLGTNAGYSMRSEGGTLTVGLAALNFDDGFLAQYPLVLPGDYIRLTVIDTGVGMSRAVQERIFEPFFTTKEVGEGAGLGLSVVHGIVRNHGGEIIVESAPDRGTRFDIFFRRCAAVVDMNEKKEEERLDGPERVLFVDDEEEITAIAKEALERRGYSVTVQTDTIRALEWLKSNPDGVDIIIANESMPGLSGMGLAKAIHPLQPSVPFILITGFSQWFSPSDCRKWGIREIVMKPLITRDLCRAIRRALEIDASINQENQNGSTDTHS